MFRGDTVVVAGNGTSVGRIAPGRVLATDPVVRTNNFFFEQSYHLGRRVDLFVAGGDPRVAPFMFETLYQCRGQYDLHHWTTHNPNVARAGKRRFPDGHIPMALRDAHVEAEVTRQMARYQRKPMTGTYAALVAHGQGATGLVLAGLDIYGTGERYPFQPGRHYQSLMKAGRDAAGGVDSDQHDAALDVALLSYLAERDDVSVWRSAPDGALADFLDLAPEREGPLPDMGPRPDAPQDWAARAGLYPIALLKVLRRGSRVVRGLRGRS